jgi:hypothetical protein
MSDPALPGAHSPRSDADVLRSLPEPDSPACEPECLFGR